MSTPAGGNIIGAYTLATTAASVGKNRSNCSRKENIHTKTVLTAIFQVNLGFPAASLILILQALSGAPLWDRSLYRHHLHTIPPSSSRASPHLVPSGCINIQKRKESRKENNKLQMKQCTQTLIRHSCQNAGLVD